MGQLHERLQREGVKTHKERVEELNKYLSRLSEHHDMYVLLFLPLFYLDTLTFYIGRRLDRAKWVGYTVLHGFRCDQSFIQEYHICTIQYFLSNCKTAVFRMIHSPRYSTGVYIM